MYFHIQNTSINCQTPLTVLMCFSSFDTAAQKSLSSLCDCSQHWFSTVCVCGSYFTHTNEEIVCDSKYFALYIHAKKKICFYLKRDKELPKDCMSERVVVLKVTESPCLGERVVWVVLSKSLKWWKCIFQILRQLFESKSRSV